MKQSNSIDFGALKSKSDKKEYNLLTLDNGLEILLVSTINIKRNTAHAQNGHDKAHTSPLLPQAASLSTSMKSAAALTVQVGSFADPEGCGGLAHFLEHMIFMGSEKYPEENLYDSFVTQHGGSCNAFTEAEYTSYQFDIHTEHFSQAIDIFAQCFISPLLSQSSVEREIKAIDNEFHLAKNDDAVRLQEIASSSDNVHITPLNPVIKKFSWGNLNSLSVIPKSMNIDVNVKLKTFYQKHYVPANCKLVVVSSKSLSELQEDVVKAFKDWSPLSAAAAAAAASVTVNAAATIMTDGANTVTQSAAVVSKKRKSESKPTASKSVTKGNANAENTTDVLPSLLDIVSPYRDMNPFTKQSYGYVTRVAAVKNTHKVHLAITLPHPCQCTYRNQPSLYVSHLVGFEGKGSLLSHLKEHSLATALSAGVPASNFDDNSMYSLFWISVSLTSKGLANWPHVVQCVYQYMEVIRDAGPQRWIFDEMKAIAQTKYDYLDEEDESDLAERLSIEMLPFMARQRTDLLGASHLVYDWDESAVRDLIQQLMCDRAKCRVFVSSSAYALGENHKDEDDDDSEEDSEDEGDDDDDEDDDEDEDEEEEEDGEKTSDASAAIIEQFYGPDKCQTVVYPPSSTSALVEPRFGTTYWVEKLPKDIFTAPWSSASPTSKATNTITAAAAGAGKRGNGSNVRTHNMHIPLPNPYIATSFELEPSLSLAVSSSSQMSALTGGVSSNASSAHTPSKLTTVAVAVQSVEQRKNGLQQPAFPRLVVTRPGLTVWHLIDKQFPLPKAELYLRMSSPWAIHSLHHSLCHDLFLRMFTDHVNELLYTASIAKLYCNVIKTDVGLTIRVSGFNDKLCRFAVEILDILMQPTLYLDAIQNPEKAAIFHREAELLCRHLKNDHFKVDQTGRRSRLLALKPSMYSSLDKLDILQSDLDQINSSNSHTNGKVLTVNGKNNSKKSDKNMNAITKTDSNTDSRITLDSIRKYGLTFFSHVTVDALAQGNLSECTVVELGEKLLAYSAGTSTAGVAPVVVAAGDTLNPVLDSSSASASTMTTATGGKSILTLSDSAKPQQPIIRLPVYPSLIALDVHCNNVKESNLAVELYYQLGEYNVLDLTKLDFLEQLISESFFDSLRTKQQLGYSVNCGVRDTFGVLGFGFQIVSSSHSVTAIVEALLAFIASIPSFVLGMEEDTYTNYLKALINAKNEPCISLCESTEMHWNQIEERRLQFSLKSDQVTILSSELMINRNTMSEFADKIFHSETTRLMMVHASPPPPAVALTTTAAAAASSSVLPLLQSKGFENMIILDNAQQLHTLPGISLYPNLV